MFKMGSNIMITDVPADFNPLEVFKTTQTFVSRNLTLHKADEELTYTVLVEKGNLSSEEMSKLHPDIQEMVNELSLSSQSPTLARVRRVQFIPALKEQYEALKKGERIVLKSSTDNSTCQELVSLKILSLYIYTFCLDLCDLRYRRQQQLLAVVKPGDRRSGGSPQHRDAPAGRHSTAGQYQLLSLARPGSDWASLPGDWRLL